MDSCDECGVTEDDENIDMHQVTPSDDADNAYDAALCDGCVSVLSEQGYTID